MIVLTLYRFEKKINSTAIPDITTPDTVMSGQLIGPFTPYQLTVRLELTDNSVMPVYNYARIGAFNRYYFVRWAYVGGFWHASLSCDVLASFRNEILGSQQYVLRSASQSDPKIIDTKYPTTGDVTRQYQTMSYSTMFGINAASDGAIVMGVINDSGYNTGAATYYIMSMATFSAFMTQMLSSIDWAGISASEISKELQKALINPVQYIVSCIWLPFDPTTYINSSNYQTTTIRLGWWTFTTMSTVAIIGLGATTEILVSKTITVPKHPQSYRGSFLNLSPFTEHMLTFWPFGTFQLDTTDLIDTTTLTLDVSMDLFSGAATLRIRNQTSDATAKAIATARTNLAVQIPTGQIAVNIQNFDSAITMAGVTAAGPVLDAMLGAVSPSLPEGWGQGSGVGGGGQTAAGLGGGRR